MTDDACWQRFMTTGKVEDYLKFKAIKEDTGSKKDTGREDSHAGFSEGYRSHLK